MHHFYAPLDQILLGSEEIILLQDEKNHLAQVLRLKLGDKICVLDGLGKKYYSTILNIRSDSAIVHIDFVKEDKPQKIKLHLFQALPKLDRFEFIIQKATELGVESITPLICKRSFTKVSEPQKRLERWKKISIEAAKQSGNSIFPKLGEILSFQNALDALKNLNCQLNLILWESERQTFLKSIIRNFIETTRRGVSTGASPSVKDDITQIAVFIGSEGGFEAEEIKFAQTFGAIPVSLGEKILRTETASITTCAIILYEFDELGGID